MLSCNRRTLLIALPAVLAACGFQPVYAPGSTATALRGKVLVKEPADRDAFLLVQDLEQRLGRPSAPEYDLDLQLSMTSQGQAVTAEGDITRFSLVGRVDYILRPIGSKDQVIARGSVDNFTGYSATGSTVEALAAERDARARLMSILAEQIVTQLYTTVDLPA